MSTENPVLGAAPIQVGKPLSMKEVAALLIKHYGVHEGQFDLVIEYQFGAGAVGPNPASPVPGVMIGITKLGLAKSLKPGPLTVDAAEVNPATSAQRRSSAAKERKRDA